MDGGEAIVVTSRLTARERSIQRGGASGMDPAAQLEALLDASAVLRASDHEHALIGGIAVGVRSQVPRATIDVDLAVRSTAGTDRLVAVMTAAGFTHRGTFDHSINFRHANGEPVQLAVDPAFDAAIGRAELVAVGGGMVAIVSTRDLIDMKRRAAEAPGRRRSKALRDLADIALLEEDVADVDEGW
ncbi:hypothetical protein BH23ACT9_BH23ACT9_34490 [soil metagenome]